ncbi:DUF4269 domain-containing protein [Bacillaceae bacterium Marseille-Q3522]|nr:DUF4269 domain-containing protein [Bacillaceae bacterium Marseille-Q3522]
MHQLGIFSDLSRYTPVLCGTIPIELDVKGSDLDIIMEVLDFSMFKKEITSLYESHYSNRKN